MMLSVIIALLTLLPASRPDLRVSEALDALIGARVYAQAHALEYKSVPKELAAIEEGATVTLREEPRAAFRGRMNLTVELGLRSGAVKRFMLGINLRTFDTAAVALAMIDRHQKLTAADVVLEQVETTGFSGEPVRSVAELEGMRSRQIIQKGKVVLRPMIEPIPVIAAGAGVTLRVKKDLVTVSVRGKARQDGWEGSVIGVDIDGAAKRMMKARVIDGAHVEAIE
ncbi:MAG: flagellar basal body P-ring formation chaperone FlgA [Acidobacteriota bacterium]